MDVNAKYQFRLKSEEKSKNLPSKVLISQSHKDTATHILLKLLGFVLFYRERLQMDTNLHMDTIPFIPNLVELDYTMKPVLWVECCDYTVAKLDKLAVKVNEAEIWAMKASIAEAEELIQAMGKLKLRRNRYNVIGFEENMFLEMLDLLKERNELTWIGGNFHPPQLQFDFNGLWFDSQFSLLRY